VIREAATAYPDLQVNVTGPGGFLADLIEVFGAIDTTLLIATALVVAIILIFVYRSPFLWLIPLIAAGIALSTASALVYILADNDIVVLNGQSQGILTVLVFGAGTDYSLLLVSRYREELHRHRLHTTAIRRALRGTVEPIVASGATTSIGLMCLLLSELNSNKSTGPVAAIGIVAAVIVMLTFLPALLAIPSFVLPILAFLVPTIIGLAIGFLVNVPLTPFLAAGGLFAAITIVGWIVFGIARVKGKGPFTRERFPSGSWAFWPRTPRFGQEDIKMSGLWAKIAGSVGRRPRVTWIATALVLLFLAGFSSTLKADGIATSESFVNAEQVDSVLGQEILVENFAAGLGSETLITANADAAIDVLEAVEATEGIDSVVWQTDLPPGAPGQMMAEPTVVDGRVLLLATLTDPPDSGEAEVLIGELREDLAGIPGADARVGGPTAVAYDIDQANLRDRNVIIPLVLFVISIILIILLRSLVAPLLLIGTVILSFFATLGACAYRLQPHLQLPRSRCVVPALRVRLPRRTGRRLQHLPDDPGARRVKDDRNATRHPAGTHRDRRSHHQRWHRSRGHLPGTRSSSPRCAASSRLRRRPRRVDRRIYRPDHPGAGSGLRHRPQSVVAERAGAGRTAVRSVGVGTGRLRSALES